MDSIPHRSQLLTQSYCLQDITKMGEAIALLDFCNDSIKLKDYEEVIALPQTKRHSSLPAVKLTRFGVRKDLIHRHIGTYALNMVKAFFVTENRTGCRFITVDSYVDVVGFYEKNNFKLLTNQDTRKDTRTMVFDLKFFVLDASFDFSIG